MASADWPASSGPCPTRTRATPAMVAAAVATWSTPSPSTSISTGPSSADGMDDARGGGGERAQIVIGENAGQPSQRLHIGDVIGNDAGEFGHRADSAAGDALGGRGDLVDGEARGEIDAEFGGGADGQAACCGPSSPWAARRCAGVLRRRSAVTMAGSGQGDGDAAEIDLAGDFEGLAFELDLGGEGRLRAIGEARRASGRHDCCRHRRPACPAAPDRAVPRRRWRRAAWRWRGFQVRHRFRPGCRDGRPWRARSG